MTNVRHDDATSKVHRRRPRVYFAGGNEANQWRRDLIGAGPGPWGHICNPHLITDFGHPFLYCGPFHPKPWPEDITDRGAFQFKVNRPRLLLADWVFSWFDGPRDHVALLELGLAYAEGIPITAGFSSDPIRDAMWMVPLMAREVLVGTAAECWASATPPKLDWRPSY